MSPEELEAYKRYCEHFKELESIFGEMCDFPPEDEKRYNAIFMSKCTPIEGVNFFDL